MTRLDTTQGDPMQITIKGRHWKVHPEFRAYAEQRIGKLQRYFSHLISAQLTVTEERYRHQAELRIFGNGVDVTGRAQDPDPRVALDMVLEKQERALKRRKEQIKDHKKKNGRTLRKDVEPVLEPDVPARKRDGIEIVRTSPKPRLLSEDQAVRLLLKSKAPVLVFSEPEGRGLKVAYRLGDGQVGLLELD